MKSCPHCQSTYEDWIEFCFNDGIPLVAVEARPAPAPRPPAPKPPPPAEARAVSGADLPEPGNLSRFQRGNTAPASGPSPVSPVDLPARDPFAPRADTSPPAPAEAPVVVTPADAPVVPSPSVDTPAVEPASVTIAEEETTTVPDAPPPPEVRAAAPLEPPPQAPPEPPPAPAEPPPAPGPPSAVFDPEALRDIASALEEPMPDDGGTRPFLPPLAEESEDARGTIPMYTPVPEPRTGPRPAERPTEKSVLDDDDRKKAAGAGIGLALMGFIGLFAFVAIVGVGVWWTMKKEDVSPRPPPVAVKPLPAPAPAPTPAPPVLPPVEVAPPPEVPPVEAALPPASSTTAPVATATPPPPATTTPASPSATRRRTTPTSPTTPPTSTTRPTAPVDNSASVTSDSVWGETSAPTSGSLRILTDPEGATVFVNDVSKGKTPMVVDLPYGAHQIKVVRAGYKTEIRDVNIRVRELTVPITLKPDVVTGQVNVYGPDGYRVVVDGHDMGLMPVTVQVSEGVRSFKLVSPDGTSCTLPREVKFKAQGRPETITLACP